MAIPRITQRLMFDRSVTSMQAGLGRLAQVQEHLTTGRVLNRPSDSPADTSVLMQHRTELRELKQHARNANDGLGWLNQAETVIDNGILNLNTARNLALQAANSGAMDQAGREAMAAQVDQIRAHLLVLSNEDRLGRPLFGGTTSGDAAYDATGTYVGTTSTVTRTIADGEQLRVDVSGPDTFGNGATSVFAVLADLSTTLRTPGASVAGDLDAVDAVLTRFKTAISDIGARSNRLQSVVEGAATRTISLTSSISSLQDVDLAEASLELGMREVSYQAALAASARVVQPSLLDFLR